MVGLAPNGPNPRRKGRFHSGPIVFKVQGVLHRVPRYGFEKLSTEYATLFPISDPEGIGKDDDHPILLEDVGEAEFEGFLDVLYPTSLFDPVELSAMQWLGVLSLATRWSMPKVREVVVERISKDTTQTPFEKLAIAQKYNVSTWITKECEAIAKDFHQIKSIEELSSQIGWESAARIAWAAAQRPDQEADPSGPHDVRPDPPPLGPRWTASLISTENEPGFGQDGVHILRNGFQSSPKLVISDFGYDAGGWRVNKHVRLVGPTTVRGSRDIIGFGDAGVLVSRNLGNDTFGPNKLVVNDFGYAQGWRVGLHVRYVSDLRKTGLVDIIGFGHSGVMVSLNNGDGTFGQSRLVLPDFGVVSGWRPDRHLRFLADVTGNGLPDIVGFGDSSVVVALNRGDGTFQEGKAVVNDLAYSSGGWRVDMHPRTVADVTGDGKADIVGFGDGGVHIALNDGNGNFHPPKLVINDFGYSAGGWRVDKHFRFVADVTGNGVGDIVGLGDAGVYVAINNGDGTFQAPELVVKEFGYVAGGWRVRLPRFVVDLNGDGAADIIGFGNKAVWVSYNDGKGNFGPAHTLIDAFGLNGGQWNPDKTVRWVTSLDL